MKIYTIIVTYNGRHKDWIGNCITSLQKSSLPTEIIVVDNNSKDDTVQFIKKKFSNVFLIENKENTGFGKANNQGISHALKHNAEYVFLLNQDAYVMEDTLEKLINVARQNPEYGIISPIHLDGEGNNVERDFLSFASSQATTGLVNDALRSRIEDKIYSTYFVNAAAWLITKKCLKIVGGFSPTFYHYGEDNNYCHRAHFHKIKIGIYPFAFILHDRDTMPPEHADLSVRSFKDQIVGWADPTKNTEMKPTKLHLVLNIVKYRFFVRDRNVVNASKKLLRYKVEKMPELRKHLSISKSALEYKFLDYETHSEV